MEDDAGVWRDASERREGWVGVGRWGGGCCQMLLVQNGGMFGPNQGSKLQSGQQKNK